VIDPATDESGLVEWEIALPVGRLGTTEDNKVE
jgi:hypothetical protein